MLSALRNRHRGRRALVLGLGPSIAQLPAPHDAITIGVNDIARHTIPDYLVVVDRHSAFTQERLSHILEPAIPCFLTALWHYGPRRKDRLVSHGPGWSEVRPDVVKFHPLAGSESEDFGEWNHQGLHVTGGTPLTAASLAGYMGCTDIGVLGVDLTGHHRFDTPEEIANENLRWGRMRAFLEQHGIRIVNLSQHSALQALPKMGVEEWQAKAHTQPHASATTTRT